MKQNHHWHLLLLQSVLLFFLIFSTGKTAVAQQFRIDTMITAPGNHVDTIPEITVYGKRMNPNEKVIIYSTFQHNFPLHNSGLSVGSFAFEKDSINIFPLCVPVNNEKGFAVQIDSIYIKGSNIPPDKILLFFNLYKNNKRYKAQTATKFRRQKGLNVFIFEKGFRLPIGKSHLSFNYKLLDAPFKFTLKTNTRIRGTLYSYNKKRDEFKLTDSVQSSYKNKLNNANMESTENDPSYAAPQVKIFCSLISQ